MRVAPEGRDRLGAGSARPLRALLLGQGGDERVPGIRGHLQVEELLASALSQHPAIEATVARLPPWSPTARLAGGRWPVLHRLGLDAHEARWHVVEAERGRRRLEWALEQLEADVVHVHSHVVALRLGAQLHRRPTILSVDATITGWSAFRRPEGMPSSLRPILRRERQVLRAASAVVAWTGWSRDAVLREAPEARVPVIHPGVDTRRFTPAPSPHREHGPLRILFVGGRFADKGGFDLLSAAHELGAEVDAVTPIDLPAHAGVRMHRLSAGQPELSELYRRADVFCLPTYRDAAPLAILEAMASGLPVVSTSVAGIPELLDDGRAGCLVPPGDARELHAALEALRDAPAMRRELGSAGRARAVGHYDSVRQGERLAALMRAAVEAREAARR